MSFAWLDRRTLLAVQAEQADEHGGRAGAMDFEALDVALAWPPELANHYETDPIELAAVYGFTLARRPAFALGNPAMAGIAAETFLGLNGYRLTASDEDYVVMLMGLAAGDIDRLGLQTWLARHAAPS